jgi:hypothetical protein
MLTVGGLRVYSLIQRQVHQSVQQHQQSIPGNKGDTVMPTAAVVLELFAPVPPMAFDLDGVEVCQIHGWQAQQQLICPALGLDDFGYERLGDQKNNQTGPRAP